LASIEPRYHYQKRKRLQSADLALFNEFVGAGENPRMVIATRYSGKLAATVVSSTVEIYWDVYYIDYVGHAVARLYVGFHHHWRH
jgi:hypothetical protein